MGEVSAIGLLDYLHLVERIGIKNVWTQDVSGFPDCISVVLSDTSNLAITLDEYSVSQRPAYEHP